MQFNFDTLSQDNLSEFKITRIGETKRGRFSLFINSDTCEQFLFSIDDETLLKSKISVGTVLSYGDLYQLNKTSESQKAKEKAYCYLSLRDYSTKELSKKLRLKFDIDSVNFAISEMQRLCLLDDERFAQNRAKSLLKNGKSQKDTFNKLVALGVDSEAAQSAVYNIPVDECEVICRLVEKSYLEKLANGKIDNVIGALIRRGFCISDIKNALSQFEITSE